MSNQITIDQQHKSIYDLFSYDICGETVHIMKDFTYYRNHNSYRVLIKSGQILSGQIIHKLNKANWEITSVVAEESINYKTKPLPDVFVNLAVSIKPREGGY